MHRRRTGLVVAGAVIFGLSYGGAVFLSAAMINSGCCQSGMAFDFLIPILGPVAGGPAADTDVMLLWSGAQLAGAVMLYYGLKGEDVPVVRAEPTSHSARRGPTLQLVPLLARGTGGLALTARW